MPTYGTNVDRYDCTVTTHLWSYMYGPVFAELVGKLLSTLHGPRLVLPGNSEGDCLTMSQDVLIDSYCTLSASLQLLQF